MTEVITYKKALSHYFMADYPDINVDWLLDCIVQLYIEKQKIWASFDYLNSILLNYLISYKHLDNPLLVFFSLIFKYINYDDYLLEANIVNELNIKVFQKFSSDLSFDLDKKSVVSLLRMQSFIPNDLNISENDYNYFYDILLYSQPLNVFDERYTCYFYDELFKIQNYFKGEKPKLSIEKQHIILLLETMQDKNYLFKTSLFKVNHSNKVNKFISHYYT